MEYCTPSGENERRKRGQQKRVGPVGGTSYLHSQQVKCTPYTHTQEQLEDTPTNHIQQVIGARSTHSQQVRNTLKPQPTSGRWSRPEPQVSGTNNTGVTFPRPNPPHQRQVSSHIMALGTDSPFRGSTQYHGQWSIVLPSHRSRALQGRKNPITCIFLIK